VDQKAPYRTEETKSVDPIEPFLTSRIVYEDDDLVEVETRLAIGDWRAKATAYASSASTQEQAKALLQWVEQTDSPFTLEIGENAGHGWCCLRFYKTDKSGHLACHVQLATMQAGRRPEEIRRLAIELPTESGLVQRFARELEAMAHDRRGGAVLGAATG
jgi:hypothetical protein